jgi:hypothetical protein
MLRQMPGLPRRQREEDMKITFAQSTQVAVFVIFCVEFLAFSLGLIHVPAAPEDAKFFYMIFGILNTILSVQALAYAAQRDNGYITPTIKGDPPDEKTDTTAAADPGTAG